MTLNGGKGMRASDARPVVIEALSDEDMAALLDELQRAEKHEDPLVARICELAWKQLVWHQHRARHLEVAVLTGTEGRA